MIFEMIPHGISERFGRAVLNDIDQPSVRHKSFLHHLFSQNSTFVNVLKYGQQHLLKTRQGVVPRDFVELSVEVYLLFNVKNHFFGIGRFRFHNAVQFVDVFLSHSFKNQIAHSNFKYHS